MPTERVTMQLNEERGHTCDLRHNCDAVVAFIYTVTASLAAPNERFRDKLNTLLSTFTTDITKTSDIRQTWCM